MVWGALIVGGSGSLVVGCWWMLVVMERSGIKPLAVEGC